MVTMALSGIREAELRRQHRQSLRAGYDGHNRRSGLVTMDTLRGRRRRRRIHRILNLWAQAYRAA